MSQPACTPPTSGVLKKSKLGAEIDRWHDVVARLNNAPVKGHEKDVGSFTTFRLTNNFYEGYRYRG